MWRDALSSLLSFCSLLGHALLTMGKAVLLASLCNQQYDWEANSYQPEWSPVNPTTDPGINNPCSSPLVVPGTGYGYERRRKKTHSWRRGLKRKRKQFMLECDINHSLEKKRRLCWKKPGWCIRLPSSAEMEDAVVDDTPVDWSDGATSVKGDTPSQKTKNQNGRRLIVAGVRLPRSSSGLVQDPSRTVERTLLDVPMGPHQIECPVAFFAPDWWKNAWRHISDRPTSSRRRTNSLGFSDIIEPDFTAVKGEHISRNFRRCNKQPRTIFFRKILIDKSVRDAVRDEDKGRLEIEDHGQLIGHPNPNYLHPPESKLLVMGDPLYLNTALFVSRILEHSERDAANTSWTSLTILSTISGIPPLPLSLPSSMEFSATDALTLHQKYIAPQCCTQKI
ncbi:unnamed protein product [Linum trigynum]|uniref:Uncharacterized protein n=1 Tax=Linum trigynum TaxID=586398 RepID=A0AAV2CDB0_9ROSI